VEIIEMRNIINAKGQLVIPSKILKQLGIKDEAFLQVDVDVETRQIIITHLRGKYKGKGLMKALMADKKRERLL
jgi:bifunctional DNA-binding transcriptional regulator/antitoxin component of YhaV-PrlF toxin-antitoxin module